MGDFILFCMSFIHSFYFVRHAFGNYNEEFIRVKVTVRVRQAWQLSRRLHCQDFLVISFAQQNCVTFCPFLYKPKYIEEYKKKTLLHHVTLTSQYQFLLAR